MSVTITGVAKVKNNIKKFGYVEQQAIVKGVERAVEHIMKKSSKIVPFDTGELQAATFSKVVHKSARLVIQEFGYKKAYAIIQHEDFTMRHPGPQSKNPVRGRKGKPKYLENPLIDARVKVLQIIKKTIQEEVRFIGE